MKIIMGNPSTKPIKASKDPNTIMGGPSNIKIINIQNRYNLGYLKGSLSENYISGHPNML